MCPVFIIQCVTFVCYISVKVMESLIQQVRKVQGSHPTCSACLHMLTFENKEFKVGFVYHRIGSFFHSQIFHLVALTLANLINSLEIVSKAGKLYN